MPFFPVFMDLEGKSVLVVGGGQVGARKARALLKSGAVVSIVASELGTELAEWESAGKVTWLSTEFSDGLLDGYWLVFAATDDQALNRAVFEAGEARRIPVNVVDDGRHCRFISPAVIDRYPVQVAVTTGGTSPVLARMVREWIERILPQGLGKVAEAAGRDNSAATGRGGIRARFTSLGQVRAALNCLPSVLWKYCSKRM
jgi:uroporphyrin-III C-methyltransferase/precorrin-2 dehydrogenase/sirohydrochlorin ferrochelatase